ncbi:MAG: OmpA family protein [Phycisphaerales bacterium]
MLVIAGATSVGCNEQKLKDEQTRLIQENEELRTEKQQLSTQLQTAQQQIATMQPQNPAPATGGPGRGSWDTGNSTTMRAAPTRETRIEVSGDKLFASGSTTIMAAGKAELDKAAQRINSEFSGAMVRVEGYTDSDPIRKSKWGTNEALSLARAREVEKYLVSRGVSSTRIESVGMGSANPKATKAASRRVEIVVLSN